MSGRYDVREEMYASYCPVCGSQDFDSCGIQVKEPHIETVKCDSCGAHTSIDYFMLPRDEREQREES